MPSSLPGSFGGSSGKPWRNWASKARGGRLSVALRLKRIATVGRPCRSNSVATRLTAWLHVGQVGTSSTTSTWSSASRRTAVRAGLLDDAGGRDDRAREREMPRAQPADTPGLDQRAGAVEHAEEPLVLHAREVQPAGGVRRRPILSRFRGDRAEAALVFAGPDAVPGLGHVGVAAHEGQRGFAQGLAQWAPRRRVFPTADRQQAMAQRHGEISPARHCVPPSSRGRVIARTEPVRVTRGAQDRLPLAAHPSRPGDFPPDPLGAAAAAWRDRPARQPMPQHSRDVLSRPRGIRRTS